MLEHNYSLYYPKKKKIAYIIGSYPSLTTTFIHREILEAQCQGVQLVIISIRRPSLFEMSPEIKRLAEETKYILPVSWLKFLRANLYFGLTRFWVYFSTLGYLLTRRHNTFVAWVMTLLHFAEGIWAAALLRPERVNHIHAHFADRAAVVALVVSRLLNVPYSLTAHANDIYVSPVLLPEKIANAKFVTTCTAYNKVYLERLIGRRIELVYHGLDLAGIAPAFRSPGNGQLPLLLSVGQLKEKKGFPYLIKACQLLKFQGYDFRCEIIGEGPTRNELKTLIIALNLQDKVILCGALPNAEVMTKYTRATLFILPCIVAENADRDGIPNVLLEAMASGVPVISTRLSGIPELIEDNVTGVLVDSGDEKQLARAIAKLLDDPQLRGDLAEKGHQFITEKFDVRRNIGRLVELLEV
ncbi:MAG: glycosyltransferase [Chloroflexi bacterium]|nr:glycosyltransferase [Chloroflexota bacterium]